jgi:hypothetical protein
MIDYSKKPIIIEGVNHSGTRLIVDILTIFGSDCGDCNNNWRENSFFLEIHNNLIDKISDKGWTPTILNIDFISNFEDTLEYKNFIENRLNNELGQHFNDFKTKNWHWKCPTSALFEKTWTSIYPDAYYIINKRDPAKIAKAFLRRRGGASMSFKDALRFYHIMENKIFSIKKKNQLIVNFDDLQNEIPKIIKFLSLKVTSDQIKLANSKINYKDHAWNSKWSFMLNLKNNWAKMIYNLYKKGIIYKRFKPEYDK